MEGWWFVVDTDEGDHYEGTFIDQIGYTIIIEVEPSKVRLGIAWQEVQTLNAYRTRPV